MARNSILRRIKGLALGATVLSATAIGAIMTVAEAHHSFAMYNIRKTYLLTGVVTRVDPNPNHLQIFVAPLNEARDKIIRDADGELVVWAVEMDGASRAARDGITVNGFPRGTIVSVGIHPLRNGYTGGGRGESGFFKCPPETPPAPGKHCDSVAGSTSHGDGILPAPTDSMPLGGNSE